MRPPNLFSMGVGVAAAALAVTAACSDIELDPPGETIHARFDPEAEIIPMPTDILRDAELGRLDLPTDGEDLSPAEVEFYEFLNTLDGWSTTLPATVEFSAPIAPATVNADTVQVWHWRETATLVENVNITLDDTETEITIDPPREGWERGGTYFVAVRGGPAGVEGKRGENVECDAAFYFLRLREALDTVEHERAFPGENRAERRDNAEQLEEIRVELAPYFDFLEDQGIPRDQVAALWSFTMTERVELAMDKASQRMPLPMNLLMDPHSHRVDIPVVDWDIPVEADSKVRLREYDGFSTSAEMMFGFTGPIDIDTINSETVQLYLASDPPELIPTHTEVLEDATHVRLILDGPPLAEQTRYVVVLRDGIRDIDGGEIALMPVGHFIAGKNPVFANGETTVELVPSHDAEKVEVVRGEVSEFLADLDAGDVLSAWSFTTMSIVDPLAEWLEQPELLGVSPDPDNVEHMTPLEALGDFILAISSLAFVGDVYNGTIESPYFLDPLTRGWRSDGGHTVEKVGFTMTVPRNIDSDEPVPVVIFGHAILTERRFVLAVADALASKGFVAISIDFPLHGERTHCWSEGPLTLPDPTTGQLTEILETCEQGYTCAPDGRCVDGAGQGNHQAGWPIIGMPAASGAAFIEMAKIANTNDHFRQSLIDLSSLLRSLKRGDWEPVIGAPVDTDNIHYAGMSLGGIIGATFVALTPEIKRIVLNVPGADAVDLFEASPFFSGQVSAFFTRVELERQSYRGHRAMNVARWFMDSTDPQSFAKLLGQRGDDVLIQMALLDIIIPNEFTLKLSELSGIETRDYLADHAFMCIPIDLEYLRGVYDAATYLDGGNLL